MNASLKQIIVLCCCLILCSSTSSQENDSRHFDSTVNTIHEANDIAEPIDQIVLNTNVLGKKLVSRVSIPPQKSVSFASKGSESNTLITIIIALGTLFLGVFLERSAELLFQRRKIMREGRRWIAELRLLEQPFNKQIEELEKFILDLKEKNWTPPSLVLITALDGKNFSVLDKSFLIQFIENKSFLEDLRNKDDETKFENAVKLANQTNGYANVLSSIFQLLNSTFKNYLSQSSIHINSYKENLRKYQKELIRYRRFIELETGQPAMKDKRFAPVYHLYETVLEPHTKDGSLNPFELIESYHRPLEVELNKLIYLEQTDNLRELNIDAINDFYEINMERDYAETNFTNINKRLSELLADLPNKITELDKT